LKKLLAFMVFCSFSIQQVYADPINYETDSSKIKAKARGEKFSKGFQKGLWFLNYLNTLIAEKKETILYVSITTALKDDMIRKIEARVLSPFGTDVDNPEKKPNYTSTKTREWYPFQNPAMGSKNGLAGA
jgi:hypothetical protein